MGENYIPHLGYVTYGNIGYETNRLIIECGLTHRAIRLFSYELRIACAAVVLAVHIVTGRVPTSPIDLVARRFTVPTLGA